MDYFNEKERVAQKKFAEQRDHYFSKIIILFNNLSITPNMVTMIGVIFLIIGCLLPREYYLLTCLLLALYLLMDGLDGGLARYQGVNHSGGSIMDMWADQMGVILIPAAAVYHIETNGVLAVLFSNAYIIFIVLIILMNQLDIKAMPFIRVKYPLYAIYLFSLMFDYDLLTWFFLIFGIYYWIGVLYSLKTTYEYYSEKVDV